MWFPPHIPCLYCTCFPEFPLRTRNPKSPGKGRFLFVTMEHMTRRLFIPAHLFAEHKSSFHRPLTGFSQKLSTLSTGFSTGQTVEKPDFFCLFWETVKKSPQPFEQLWRFSVDRTPIYPLFHISPCSKTQRRDLFAAGKQGGAAPKKISGKPPGTFPTSFYAYSILAENTR